MRVFICVPPSLYEITLLMLFSAPFRLQISLQPNCEKAPLKSQRQAYDDYDLAVLAGIVFSCSVVLLIALALILWK